MTSCWVSLYVSKKPKISGKWAMDRFPARVTRLTAHGRSTRVRFPISRNIVSRPAATAMSRQSLRKMGHRPSSGPCGVSWNIYSCAFSDQHEDHIATCCNSHVPSVIFRIHIQSNSNWSASQIPMIAWLTWHQYINRLILRSNF
jgi:hypothetical protein